MFLGRIFSRVVAHDPTVDGWDKPKIDLITFKKLGISDVASENSPVGPVVTLKVNNLTKYIKYYYTCIDRVPYFHQ